MIKLIIILLTVAIARTAPAATEPVDEFAELSAGYLAKCGGIIFSKCDDPAGLNQETLFKQAAEIARRTGRKVFLTFGADWCPPCRVQEQSLLEAPETLKKINASFVRLELNGTTKSAIAVRKELFLNITAFPTSVIYDPLEKRASRTFTPSVYSPEELLERLTHPPAEEPDEDWGERHG